jgi:monoamine oxidase
VNQHALDQELTKEDSTRLLDFLQGFGDLNEKGKYMGTLRAGFTRPRGAGPNNVHLHDPLKFSELLAADLSKGEFYEEQIDWQATMFQPIGGMDRISYGFAKVVGDLITYEAPVTDIQTGPGSVTVHYTKGGKAQVVTADWCICTMPISVLATTKNNFSVATQRAFTGMSMMALYKIGWESPRFWEKECRIYGGISFPKQVVDLVWYPSDKLFSPTGILIGGFNAESDETGKPTAFGALSREGKFEASRQAIEKLHPGKSSLLTKPIYVSWEKIPYSLGCFANNFLGSSQQAYEQLDKLEGRTIFAGDYLSHLVGWQEGATLSAHRAIDRIAKAMRG